jgi:hypothetical protein
MAEPASSPTPTQQGLPQITLPSRLAGKARSVTKTSGYSRSETLRRDDRVDPNRSIQQMRQFQTAAAQMRALSEANGLASTVITSLVAMAHSGWRVHVYQT